MDAVYENLLLQMKKLNKAMLKAKEMEGRSVVYSRKEVLEEAVATLAEDPAATLVLFGVKNTGQISPDRVGKLQKAKGYLFHTVDRMADGGRAIDPELLNPLTGRVMTGSSSGGCVNILKGINDVAIGTDGGGSVLAPAVSTGLYAVMAKGMGLKGDKPRLSTDGIPFVPGIGAISYDYGLCRKTIHILGDIPETPHAGLAPDKLHAAIPKEGSVILPGGQDMRQSMCKAIDGISGRVELVERDFSGIENRHEAVKLCKSLFDEGIDIIMTAEGPVDLFSLGDSVLGAFGSTGSLIQNNAGKYLLKAANMVDATSVAIPTGELGMGILVTGRKGMETGKAVIALGEIISGLYAVPALFRSYFIEAYNREDTGFI